MASRRWFCGACLREWVFAYRWSPEQGCPACHSANIGEVEYRPAFVGADLSRDDQGYPTHVDTVAPPRWVDVPPAPLVLTEEVEEDYAAITG
jgi:hypothetical protein